MTNLNLEKLEKRYLDYIVTYMRQDLKGIVDGLNSRIKILNDWKSQFMATARAGYNSSDLDAGAERIFHHQFTQIFKFPNSCPIGSDLMYKNDEAVVHIEIKTVLKTNSDLKGKVQLGKNQISYKIPAFSPNLPKFYSTVRLPTLTYAIQIVHEHMSNNITAISVISIPNGQLYSNYGDSILQAGKGGWLKANDVRYNYRKEPTFKLLSSDELKVYRIEVLALSRLFTIKDLTGLDLPITPYKKI